MQVGNTDEEGKRGGEKGSKSYRARRARHETNGSPSPVILAMQHMGNERERNTGVGRVGVGVAGGGPLAGSGGEKQRG